MIFNPSTQNRKNTQINDQKNISRNSQTNKKKKTLKYFYKNNNIDGIKDQRKIS